MNNIYEELFSLVTENKKVFNFKFYKTVKKEHGHELTRAMVGDFFRKFYKRDLFFDTYEYTSKKQYSLLTIKRREDFLNFLEENKNIMHTKSRIEKRLKNKVGVKNNYSDDFRFPYKAINILLYNNSKENDYIDKSRNYLLKSKKEFTINGNKMEMQEGVMGLLSISIFSNENIQINFKGTVVFVENKESYDFADIVFPTGDYLFILYGGNANKKEQQFIINNIHCERKIFFCDFDFVSLKEFNKIKELDSDIELFYGENLLELEEKIRKFGSGNLYKGQEKSQEYVLKNFDELSSLIWRIILKYEKGLEQEIFHAPML